MDRLSEDSLVLNQLARNDCVAPFKAEISTKIRTFREAQVTIKKWLKVQESWQEITEIFTQNYYINNMPDTTRLFNYADSKWKQVMDSAASRSNCLESCKDALLLGSLYTIHE